ncbi:DUF323 domain-containing protein [Cordyceps militaris CM01]|uniref:4-dimethylallyltryptophan N-methyltransferase n=1 Tax=Cordyceps militaris (strain CM01) TaxID=983644 RepID=G3JFE4_CORMM|nr:DUF323 domain-containing protein [Cordyceps militaris CM01]EGX93134.1 DUF323 domain-containing protein [Cordyceps militaris CM01]
MPSVARLELVSVPPQKTLVAAAPQHGHILDIGGSALKDLCVDRVKDTLDAIANSRGSPTLPDELLYDDEGLLLWNDIISIPQFYQTHDETALFKSNSSEIIRHVPKNITMIDLGSGDTTKVDHFLKAFEEAKVPATYLALDISKTALDESIKSLTANHSGPNAVVKCGGLWGTFDNGLQHVDNIKGPRLFLSLGSVLCNDAWPTALGHLRKWAAVLRPDDKMLIGMDGHLAADQRDKIWAAYHSCDDKFRNFFLNGLTCANKLLGYKLFDEQDWDFIADLEDRPTTRHRCFMRANKDVSKDDGSVIFKGQEIDWFDSHKYGEDDVRLMCSKAGLTVIKSWAPKGSEFRQYLVRLKGDGDGFEDCDSAISGIL